MMLTEPKAALAGVIHETSFARFIASMATFNEERVPSRPSSRWDLADMETQCGGDKTVLRAGCEEGSVSRWAIVLS